MKERQVAVKEWLMTVNSASGERIICESGSGERITYESGSGERIICESGSGEHITGESGTDEGCLSCQHKKQIADNALQTGG